MRELYIRIKKWKETKFTGTQDSSVIYNHLQFVLAINVKDERECSFFVCVLYKLLIQCHQ